MRSARPWLVVLTVTLAVALASAGQALAQARQPNIVMIVGDDMGYADIGVHGSRDIPTPNIDALAREGTRFTDAYVTGPHCSPTRAGLLTGRYQQRFGHEVNMGPDAGPNGGLPPGETTMADRLKAAGYARRSWANGISDWPGISTRCRAASTSSTGSWAETTPTWNLRRTG